MKMTASHAAVDTRRAAIAGYRLEDQGYCVLKSMVPAATIGAIADALDPLFGATPLCQGDFYGERTKRFGRLLARAPGSAVLVQHPLILSLCQRVLGSGPINGIPISIGI